MLKVCNDCIACLCCVSNYPENFQEVDGKAVVIKQPDDIESAKAVCPVGAIVEED